MLSRLPHQSGQHGRARLAVLRQMELAAGGQGLETGLGIEQISIGSAH